MKQLILFLVLLLIVAGLGFILGVKSGDIGNIHLQNPTPSEISVTPYVGSQ
ncbi:MAG: hypothetical protein UT61_C0068G0007 [Candidatus Woesebacteria bacterium GW2011_GWA1_39_8]|jgi:hypothetical protein|uniref:Uncharacterized protein n=1 Tax=Candidatus Woesebacteria bacterium GW2011_GWA1_39_8 TaxID=1618552 RepID=A0A0G0PHV2_9BACT|nr:MAG: hypothetical protein UT61_C0068G0007 [Candidatus Woesebacteria bacterium GW2011_GWA1_39_8]